MIFGKRFKPSPRAIGNGPKRMGGFPRTSCGSRPRWVTFTNIPLPATPSSPCRFQPPWLPTPGHSKSLRSLNGRSPLIRIFCSARLARYRYRASATGQRKAPGSPRKSVHRYHRYLTAVKSNIQTESSGLGAPDSETPGNALLCETMGQCTGRAAPT